jgi:Pyruvate/2-oxoacid:ferredoxin oxidoreductase delta subunit
VNKNNFINLTLGGQKWTPIFIAGIDPKLCMSCYTCFAACPANVFVKTVKGTVEALHRERCIGCGVCCRICPEKAITCLNYAELEVKGLIPGNN